VLRDGAATSKRSAAMLDLLRQYSSRSLPSARTAGVMFPTLESRGFVDDLLSFFYNMAVATARHDENGHILPAHVGVSSCSIYASEPNEDCGATDEVPADERESRRRTPRRGREGKRQRGAGPSSPAAPSPAAPEAPAPDRQPLPPAPAVPQLPDNAPGDPPLDALMDFLLG
jgi:hypothetical protein